MVRRWLSILLPLLVLSGAVYMRVEDPQVVQELRLKVFDNYQKIKPRTFNSEETPARIVDIDEASLKKFGQWHGLGLSLIKISEPTGIRRNSVAVLCLKKKNKEKDRGGKKKKKIEKT